MIVSPDHWLTKARRAPSGNHDARPDPEDISLVVVHGISLPPGEFGTGEIERFFCNTLDRTRDPRLADLEGVRVSAHLLVSRQGALTQFVAFDRRAWHAGVSRWRGRPGCNDFSIGIELEGTDDSGYTSHQYVALARTLDALAARYPLLDRSALVGHNEIAPGRKTDPGPHFDWQRVHRGVFQSPQPGSARVSLAERSSARVSLAEESSARVSPSEESSAKVSPSGKISARARPSHKK